MRSPFSHKPAELIHPKWSAHFAGVPPWRPPAAGRAGDGRLEAPASASPGTVGPTGSKAPAEH